jgi:arylsulfatase A-like enzyme
VATIEGYAKSKEPFLLSLHFTAPHWPWEGPDDEAESKRIRSIFHRDGGTQKTYMAMMQSLDGNIGRVLQALDVHGLSANTVVIFTSDNGGERFSNIWPFSGMKGELLEGGLRIPAIVRWPGRIPAGAVSEQVMISMDWLPTLLAAAGTQPDFPPILRTATISCQSSLAARRPIRASCSGVSRPGSSAPSAMATGNICRSPAMSSCSTS